MTDKQTPRNLLGKVTLTSIVEEPVFQSLGALSAALIVIFCLLPLLGHNPIEAYSSLFSGAFGSLQGFGETVVATTPLLISSLGFIFAYKCALFNIGLEGQIAIGGLIAAYLGYSIAGLPAALHITLTLGACMIGGMLWGIGPGILKARYGIHEVITTIMLNYVAFRICQFMVSMQGPMKDRTDQMPASPPILSTAFIGRIVPGTRLHWGILLALLFVVISWFVLSRTRLGFKLRAVGKNAFAAETGGISASRHTVIAMMISSSLGALAGGVEILGIHHRLFAAFSPGYGFDAIAVALLGGLQPFGVIVSAFIFGALRSGAILMQAKAGVSKDIVQVISTVVIFVMAMADPLGRALKRRVRQKSDARTSF